MRFAIAVQINYLAITYEYTEIVLLSQNSYLFETIS